MQWLLAPRRSEEIVNRFVASARAIDRAIKQEQFWQNSNACFRMGTCEFVPLCYASAADQRDQKLQRTGEQNERELFTGWDD